MLIDKISVHNVYVVDEEGMGNIFADLKQTLVLQHDTTLIYVSPNDNLIFDRELDILQKRFPTQFILYPAKVILIDNATTLHELLEAVINANTKESLAFTLSGDAELIHVVSNQLWFLGICQDHIRIKSLF